MPGAASRKCITRRSPANAVAYQWFCERTNNLLSGVAPTALKCGLAGHASITVTAHIYADLYDDELDDIAAALDALDDVRGDLPSGLAGQP